MRKVTVLTMAAALMAGPPAQAVEEPTLLDPISVWGQAGPRSPRSDAVAPALVYDADVLRRFEPVSAGELIRRLPGVVFNSEAGQSDAPQLRGIGPEYTQVLIDGRRIPGAENDRGLLLDHIPPELIERIEILRSPTAEQDAQGVGGTINLVLKSGTQMQAAELRTDLAVADDGRPRGGGYLAHSGTRSGLSWLAAMDVRGRREPREKRGRLLEPGGSLVETTRGVEARDGSDTGLNGHLSWQAGPALLDLHSFAALSESDTRLLLHRQPADPEDEPAAALFERDEDNEDTAGLAMRLRVPGKDADTGGWDLSADAGWGRVQRDSATGEQDDMGAVVEETERQRSRDRRLQLGLSREFVSAQERSLRLGLQASHARREASMSLAETEDGMLQESRLADGTYDIEEDRLDTYLQHRRRLSASIDLDLGLRVEHTATHQTSLDVESQRAADSSSRLDPSPNLHLRWKPDAAQQIQLSAARTLRRPDFNELAPFRSREDDRFVLGNPDLRPERAIGADLGYRRRLPGRDAGLGVNIFYREIENLIERRRVAENTVSPVNEGRGRVWGLELDGDWSPGLAGLSFTGNLSLLDSSVRDPFVGERRRFQLQPAHAINLGVEQDIPRIRTRWGVNLNRTGASREPLEDEITHRDYGTGLYAYVEHRLSGHWRLRLSGRNLLESRVTESVRSFDGTRPEGELEQLFTERETLGPILALSLRARW